MKATAWLFLCLIVAPPGAAQPAPAAEVPTTAQQLQPNQPPQELKVTEYSLPPDKLAKAEALYQTRTMLYLFGMVFGIVVLWLLLKLRVGPAFRDLAERVSKNSLVQALVFVPLLTLSIADHFPAHRHLRAAHIAFLRTLRAGLAFMGGGLVQGRRSLARHPRSNGFRPLSNHSQESAALVVLLLAAGPAVPGPADLCHASHPRPHVQHVRAAGEKAAAPRQRDRKGNAPRRT